MRQLLLASICLSLLVAAQNVLAIAPSPQPRSEVLMSAVDQGMGLLFVPSPEMPGGHAPDLGTTALFFVGVAGLGVAGSRRCRRCLPD
jgi:hypothetical protein